jgi:uncharacterized protein (TIGR03790 family)
MRENNWVKTQFRCVAAWLFAFWLCPGGFAGGSGLNVVVVVNQNSANSVELGNYYCEQRGVPSQNLLRINWAGGMVDWTRSQFEATLRAPLNTMLAVRQLTNQIDYVLLSMDIPYRVTENTGVPQTSGVNSTTAALFYGFKLDGDCSQCPVGLLSCSLAPVSANLYAGTEAIYRQTPPISATSNNWMVMMLTSSNLPLAKAVVDRGVASDRSFPTQSVYLAKSYDLARNIRYLTADDAIFDARVRGNYSIRATNLSSSSGLTGLLGFQNGVQAHSVTPDTFVPGALVDNLTSYGGAIFENSDHTDALDYLIAGATASHGTVVEPCAYFAKFASPRNYFYQARGFSAAECYYQSLTNPYQGILVGEPLASPFALPASGAWSSPPGDAVVSGSTNLSLQFTSPDTSHPIQQVDLFVDGLFARTITNLPPRTNNVLYVTLNGIQTNYTVPAGANLKTIAANLAARLNQNSFSNATKVGASACGDRIVLHGLNASTRGNNILLSASNYLGSASVLATFVTASRSDFLDSPASGFRNFFVTNVPAPGSYLLMAVTKTNGTVVNVGATNSSGNTDPTLLVQALANAINANVNLNGADGVIAEDVFSYLVYYGLPAAEFNLRARSPGWPEAQIQAQLTASSPLQVLPGGVQRLEEFINDLRPRNHLYLTAGLTNLNLTFPFNTTTNADGYHELTAVAYEGSHVRTQKRISLPLRIQNNAWSATFTTLLGGSNTALEATLQFAVSADTDSITKIELFTTGGLFATSNNLSSTTFSIAATNLGIGLHPFYALVTRSDGKQYRTETKWLRIIGPESPFSVSVAGTAPTLFWPAAAGRGYQVLSTTDATNTFLQRAMVTPTNSTGSWSETNRSSPQRFYRVKTP